MYGLSRLPTLAMTAVLYILIITLLAAAQSSSPNQTCRPVGECEPCPEDALEQPFCQPFGNRRLYRCDPLPASGSGLDNDSDPPLSFPPPSPQPSSSSSSSSSSPPPPSLPPHDTPAAPMNELPAWESCGRIIAQERADFREFVGHNLVFAAVSLVVLYLRSKRLQALQARHLAARIGQVRSSGSNAR